MLLIACSSNLPKVALVKHNDDRGIPAIDDVIVEMKTDFVQNCYGPVAMREVPETRCQTDLFQLLERRYRMNYKQVHVKNGCKISNKQRTGKQQHD